MGSLVQHMEHGVFVDAHDTGSFQGGCRLRPNRLSGEAGFSQKAALLQNGDDGFSALLRDHGQLDLATLDIEHGVRRIPLRIEKPASWGRQTRFAAPTLSEECLGIERQGSFGLLWPISRENFGPRL